MNGLGGTAPPIVLSEGISWASCGRVDSDSVGCESGARESVLLVNPHVCLQQRFPIMRRHPWRLWSPLHAFKVRLCCFLAGWPWVNYFTSLWLTFLICKMWLAVLPEVLVNIKREIVCEALGISLTHHRPLIVSSDVVIAQSGGEGEEPEAQ